jgi:scyllo-inositol 2-dehydrogenase (NADP+)
LKLGKKPNLISWGTENEGQEGLLHAEIEGKISREKVPTLQGNYYDYFDGVYESIANGKSEPVTAEDGVNVMRIIEAAFLSNEQKKVIDL